MAVQPDPMADEATWVEALRVRARETWGSARASAIDDAVRRTALCVRRLMQLEFEPSEAPAFYLDRPDRARGADE